MWCNDTFSFSASVIEELHKNLEQIENEDSTEAVILMGANDIFSGGADINEFKASNFVSKWLIFLKLRHLRGGSANYFLFKTLIFFQFLTQITYF